MPQYLSPGVYVEEKEAGSRPIEGVGTAVAGFLGFAADGPFHQPTLVTNWSQFQRVFGGFRDDSYLAHSVYSFFNNGGGAAYVVRVRHPKDDATTSPATAEISTGGDDAAVAYRVHALAAGTAGNDVVVEVTHPDEAQPAVFTLTVFRPGADDSREVFENLTTQRRGRQSVVSLVNERSKLIRIEDVRGSALEIAPPAGAVTLDGGTGSVTTSLTPEDYVGNAQDRTGFAGLEAVDTVTMVCAPDLMAAHQQGLIDAEQVKAVQLALIAHCEQMGDRLAILDPPPHLSAQQVRDWRVDDAGYDSKYAALYWPWLKVFDPASGQNRFMPPSGALAGIWARNDAARGVHKAPANEVVRGAVDVEYKVTKAEHDLLNPVGVNCLRSFPGRGLRVWGARTLSSDPSWRYVNVRRLFNYLEGSILAGTDWVVFEPNDPDLWGRIRRTISAFLYRVWLDGALFGATPDQAFYVKCDDETNPSELIEAGQVTCEVGVAVVKPAEFVVFRLAQLPTGTSALSE